MNVARAAGRPAGETVMALLVILVWSTCYVVIAASDTTVPPLLYAALRALIAGGALLVACVAVSAPLRPASHGSARATWAWLALLGLTNTTLGLAGMFLSVGAAGAALPAVLANSQALLVAPLAAWWFGEALTPTRLGGVVVGVGGVALVMWGSASGWGTERGVVLALGAAAGLAAGNLIIKRLSQEVDALAATAWQYLIGGAALLGWSALTEGWHVTPTAGFIAALAFLALVGSAAASYVWYRLLQRGELIRLNALTLLTPVFSLAFALVVAYEPFGWLQALGVAAILGGVIAASWPEHPGRRES